MPTSHNARAHTEHLYRASDDAGRPLPRRLRANSFDISSPPHSILIQRTSGAAQLAADEAEQREREIPGLPKRRGSVGGTGAESLREFNNRGIEESTPEDDVFFEREYVVVEKKVIEMNELADQFAASPQNNMVVRHTNSRTRIPFSASTSPSSPPVIRPSSPISVFSQGITPPPPSAQNQFVYSSPQSSASYYGTTPPFANSGSPTGQQQERPWGSPTTSAGSGGSALAKAISISKLLLGGTGTGNSPPSRSDKYLSNRRGSSGSTSSGNAIVVFRAGGDDPEEDAAIKAIEDAAHKAYAVEQFAQSKYDMIAPPPPTAPDPLPSQADTTPQDKARIAEEAFVLYLKTLALLQSGMDVAKEHWEKQRAELTASSPAKVASSRLNDAVQWIRDRFNECLEKAEIVKSKCPPEEKDYNQLMVKLIYDRALEMSRTAAVNELRGADMPGCEHAYQTSIWMLKAILDVQLQGEDDEAMDDDDQRVVNKFISSITNRLKALRRKAELAATVVSGSPSSLG
ncbi:hypothetical protein BC938DRAFT_479504 [Jimgerdemannia flammicorona]|uniref:Uncharacterized protein n=1 Tax=Jimgerdemannia flammicorona TaxID=994334 RepID=A0A433QKP0_9FUNG|nr:hypothetical protein BC938DRAFT_479504 [Jimgerdemannia flammicorona]